MQNLELNGIHIVYASDNNFAEILGVSMVSLFENNKHCTNILVYILDSGISELNHQRLNDVCISYNRSTPIWIPATNINEILGLEVKIDRGSLSQYARLFLSSTLPKDLQRILYLDCDIIIDKPIDELWNMDMQGKTIAALMDAFSKQYRKNIGLQSLDIMFNSGVMLIDLKRWEEKKIEEKLLKLIASYNGFIQQGDQGALNAVLSYDMVCINPKYNSITIFYDFIYQHMMIYRKPPKFYSEEEVIEAVNNPHIIHFTTSFLSRRPWIVGSEHIYKNKWLTYKAISPWKNEPLREYSVSKFKNLYIEFYKALPIEISVRISGLLQAYGRPLLNRIRLINRRSN